VEKDSVEDALVLKGDLGQGMRHGEDDVEVGDGQKLALTLGEPLLPGRALTLGAMAVAAGVVRDGAVAAFVAGIHVAAEGGRAAGLDGGHHAPLFEGQHGSESFPK
jgi:hypothetical protein